MLKDALNSATKNGYVLYEANKGASRNKDSMKKSMTDFCDDALSGCIQGISPIKSNRLKENSDSKPVVFQNSLNYFAHATALKYNMITAKTCQQVTDRPPTQQTHVDSIFKD